MRNGYLRLAAILVAIASPAMAQIDYSTSYIQAPLWNSINQSNPIMTEDFSADKIYDDQAPIAATNFLRFKVSETRREQNIADYIVRVKSVDKAYAPVLAAELSDGRVFASYSKMLRSLGLDSSDLGDNLTMWWVTAWEAANLDGEEPPASALTKVRMQVRRLLSNSMLSELGDAEKQAFSDSLIIQSLVLANQIDQVRSKPREASQLAKGIKKSAAMLGLDLNSMTLTKDGFVPRPKKRADAADASTSAGATATVAKDASHDESEKEDSAHYALIAAGAGLGGAFLLGRAMARRG
jgi:hypothetical protein